MHRPSLYSRASFVQRHDANEIVNEYAKSMEQHTGGKQSLLDVGTGTGDVLVEIIVPVLAKGFSRITGIDISPKMVEYARNSYGYLEGVAFKELNIETEQLPKEFHEQFDRVTSFYCLQWIVNQRKALENIFKSLRPNGDCLLILLGSNTLFDVYRTLSKHPRWKDYQKEVDRFVSPLTEHTHIAEEYESLLEQVGFVDRRVEVKQKTFTFEGRANFKCNIKAVNPFPLSEAEFDEYYEAFSNCMDAMGCRETIPGAEDHRFLFKHALVVIFARKGE